MNKTELDAIINDAVNDSELSGSEIPAIDLYVDQIINLVCEKQKQGSERYSEKQLTKTMINNYSKDGVITPVKGKKYTREQILQILTVYSMKSTLSIGEIKRMLLGMLAVSADGKALGEIYDRYMEIKSENKSYAGEVIDEMLEVNGLDVSKEADYLAAIGGIVSLSAYFKSIAQAMIDAKYPEEKPKEESEAINESEDKKKEKKDKKEEKKEKKKKEKER